MELAKAKQIAERVKEHLSPVCDRIEVAGSIRRQRPFVHDIDMVLIPSNQGEFYYKLLQLGQVTMSGAKLMKCKLPEGIVLEIYVATRDTWPTLLLIRTGSKSHNVRLCSLARKKGWRLHADGRGIEKPGGWIQPVKSEEEIYTTLGLQYLAPEDRE